MEGFSEQTAQRFEVRGYGDTLRATLNVRPNVEPNHFFWTIGPRLRRLREPTVHGFLSFQDTVTESDVFLNHDVPLADLTVITCHQDKPQSGSPSCEVRTKHSREGFFLTYWFARSHLRYFREIDTGVKSLFEEFSATAN